MPGIFDVKTESGETMSENKRNYGKRNVKKRLEKIDSPGIRYAKRLSLSFFTTLLIGGLIAVLICIFMGFGIVKRIIDECYEKAKKIILEHEDVLHSCSQLLIEKEKIGQEEFESLFSKQASDPC